jgi:xanthine dehydrogenase accessory factor
MSDIFAKLTDQLKQEKGVALATLVRGPGEVGAKLLVYPGKRAEGTLGNAALDARVIDDAERAIWNGDAGTRTYSLETEPTS